MSTILQWDEKINEVYYPLLFNEDRYLVLMGGAGSGKSVFAAQKIIGRCLKERHRFLIIRKVSDTLKDSVFKLIVGRLSDMGILGLCEVNKTEKTITFPNKSEILMKGLDDPEKIKSIAGITGIWVEEATELQSEDFDQLDLRLRGETPSYKQIIFSFNPISEQSWLKARFFDDPPESCTTLVTTYEHNHFIDPEYRDILELKAKTNPNFYRVYKLGQWGVPEVKRPFAYNFDMDRHVSQVHKVQVPLRFSQDFNVDPMANVVCQMWFDKDGHHIHFLDELALFNSGTEEMISQVKTRYTPSELANCLWTGDATSRKRTAEQTIKSSKHITSWVKIDQAFKLGKRLHTPRANPSVSATRELLNTMLALHPDIKFSPSMKRTINELTLTEADGDGGILKGDRKDVERRADFIDCFVGETMITTQCGQKRIDEIEIGEYVLTRFGYKKVIDKWDSEADVYEFEMDNGVKVICTKDHKFYAHNYGFLEIFSIFVENKQVCELNITGEFTESIPNKSISIYPERGQTTLEVCTGKCGMTSTVKYPKDMTFITKTGMRLITLLKTLNLSPVRNTCQFTCGRKRKRQMDCGKCGKTCNTLGRMLISGMGVSKALIGIKNTLKTLGLGILHLVKGNVRLVGFHTSQKTYHRKHAQKNVKQDNAEIAELITSPNRVLSAVESLSPTNTEPHYSAQNPVPLRGVGVKSMRRVGSRKVYDITVDETPEFFANGILAHNCVRYTLWTWCSDFETNMRKYGVK